MNKKIKKLWVDALKSGEYKQTIGALHDEDGYCCLGVLCDIHAKAKKKKAFNNVNCNYLGSTGLLPKAIVKWAKLEEHAIKPDEDEDGYNIKVNRSNLADLNDSRKSFNYIAQKIEKYL